MRGLLQTTAAILFLIGVAFIGQMVANSRAVEHNSQIYRYFASHLEETFSIPDELIQEVHNRVTLYNSLIEKNHLLDGMVVQKNWGLIPEDVCDSLLFSSLRYVSLKKLGYHDKAQKAWNAIEKSQENGQWFRHPRCRKTTSRDMLLGILAAFTQEPPRMRQHLEKMLSYVTKNSGYISKGRFDIAFLLPGVAEILRIYSRGQRVPEFIYPTPVALSFSTIEFASLIDSPGYRSHLIAMTSWIELELAQNPRYAPFTRENRTALAQLSALTEPFTKTDLPQQRLSWITEKLFRQDPQNLFFKWLRLRTANAVTPVVRGVLLAELLNMPQFPKSRLPRDCDRKADYLWQRASWEYTVSRKQCLRYFNGVDFLWMAGLLLDPSYDNVSKVRDAMREQPADDDTPQTL